MEYTDVVVVGASFSGLTLGHHLPQSCKVIIIDRKPSLDTAIETTGLITQATYDLFKGFCDVDSYIPNRVNAIGVVGPDFKKSFFSQTDQPWIYTTDTPQLVRHISETLPTNVELKLSAAVLSYEICEGDEYPVHLVYQVGREKHKLRAKFLVGADGSHSIVGARNLRLSKNKKFLAAQEKVFYGEITFGPQPESTVYHYWFGEFSLGYGGWLSPTTLNGRKAFRLGLAKEMRDASDLKRVNDFIDILKERKMIKIADEQCAVSFAHLIPIGGALKNISDGPTLLIGDAAGFCGAFAADGIKGALLSGKIAGRLIPQYLDGDLHALNGFHKEMQAQNKMMSYYKKQLLYRWIWEVMKSNRTFDALFDLIARQKEGFLNQFCDSKDRHKSLMSVVLRFENIPALIKYSWYMVMDLLKRN